AASVPLYICATSSTPLAHALVIGGLSPGAALVLLLAGPATNIATVTWLWKELGSRSTVIYLGSIAVVALGAGIVVDALAPTLRIVEDASAAGGHEHAGVWSMIGAGAMLALIAGHLAAAVWRRAARSPEPSCCGSD
ncbi:MAG: permease, partial [Planctomycetota bacterium]